MRLTEERRRGPQERGTMERGEVEVDDDQYLAQRRGTGGDRSWSGKEALSGVAKPDSDHSAVGLDFP